MKLSYRNAAASAAIALAAASMAHSVPALAQGSVGAPSTAAMNPTGLSTIMGSLGYRERMLPPPGSIAIISLQDISLADAPAQTLVSVRYDVAGHGVPFGYELKVPTSRLMPGHRYSVRGEIRGADGNLLWTTDTAQLIDPSLAYQVLPTANMVRAGSGNADTGSGDNAGAGSLANLVGPPWQVEYIAGRGVVDNSMTSIKFMDDGKVGGSTGCNPYSGAYTVNGDAIKFSTFGVGRRACVPAVSDQEQNFLATMANVNRYKIDPRGALVLYTSDDKTIVAARKATPTPY